MGILTLDRKPLSIAEYVTELAKNGTPVMPGTSGAFWVGGEPGALMRIPTFCSASPALGEVRKVLWRGKAAVISFVIDPDKQNPPNAWLYICRDGSYSLHKLSKEARRDIRRAQRSLRIEPVDWPTLLNQGFLAYSDTRSRAGLSDGTYRHFRGRFERFSNNPGHYVIGAWREDALLAFMTLIVVDDWVAIEGCFSTSAHRDLCPNNGLAHYVLDYFLVQRGFRTVTYGISSIQKDSSESGLHFYKRKVGFEAHPVRRAFMLHPFLRPLANRITLWTMNSALRFRPADRRLLKAVGVLSSLLGERRFAKGVLETRSNDEGSFST